MNTDLYGILTKVSDLVIKCIKFVPDYILKTDGKLNIFGSLFYHYLTLAILMLIVELIIDSIYHTGETIIDTLVARRFD